MTHIASGNKMPCARDERAATVICRKHDATLVVNRIPGTDRVDWRTSSNAWWINAEDLGHAFTSATMAAIRRDLDAKGIVLE